MARRCQRGARTCAMLPRTWASVGDAGGAAPWPLAGVESITNATRSARKIERGAIVATEGGGLMRSVRKRGGKGCLLARSGGISLFQRMKWTIVAID